MIECVSEAVCNKSNNKVTRDSELKRILNDEYTILAVNNAVMPSMKMKIAILPIKWKNELLCTLMGKAIGFMKHNFSDAFYRMRSGIAQKANERR